jgi:SRSO17 transposase
MTLRWLAAGTLAAALLVGCRSAPTRWSSAPASAPAPAASEPDPDRWERAVCHKGEYPAEIDARALTSARYEDLQARQSGSSSSFATARLESERNAFDARCAAWRAARNGTWASATGRSR